MGRYSQILLSVISLFCVSSLKAAPFDKDMAFTQPNGKTIEIHGTGDEFYAVFTHSGYPIVFNGQTRAYDYALLSGDRRELVSSGIMVGTVDPRTQPQLSQDIEISDEAKKALIKERRDLWERTTGTGARWTELQKSFKQSREASQFGPTLMAREPGGWVTTGEKVGLTLLIDFPDSPFDIEKEEIEQFLNGEGYKGYGNSGSVREYFRDVSHNNLDYSNVLVGYIRLPHPKSDYVKTDVSSGENAQRMITDALNVLKKRPDFRTEIVPLLQTVTKDKSGKAMAFNVFYAGLSNSPWSKGLWPHSFALARPYPICEGLSLQNYQVCPIEFELSLATFCHENGHMLCGFPDLYDYTYQSHGGSGAFCLMGANPSEKNPVQICGYLKYVAGWTQTIPIDKTSYIPEAMLTADPTADAFNTVYLFQNEGAKVPGSEYYLIETRQQNGRDESLPASGLAIWHVDEFGDRDNANTDFNPDHENYVCTLMQADGKWDFQKKVNTGDSKDLFYKGNGSKNYENAFTDLTVPSARWWNGEPSGLSLTDISFPGMEMTFAVRPIPPEILNTSLAWGRVGSPYSVQLLSSKTAEPCRWEVIGDVPLPDGLTLDPETGLISGLPTGVYSNTIQVTASIFEGSLADTNSFPIVVYENYSLPFCEEFSAPLFDKGWGWSQSPVTNDPPATVFWTFENGNTGLTGQDKGHPYEAYSPALNAVFRSLNQPDKDQKMMLVSPMLDFGENPRKALLSFYLFKEAFSRNLPAMCEKLRIYSKPAWDQPWEPLTNSLAKKGEIKVSVDKWRKCEFEIPNPSRTTYIAFEGEIKNGYGIHIDDVWIGDPTRPVEITTPGTLPDAEIHQPYEIRLDARGGIPPYTFSQVGEWPAGLTLEGDRVSGTIDATGSYTIGVAVVDSQGERVEKALTFLVDYPRYTLYTENFESGTMPPAGWEEEGVTSDLSWKSEQYNNRAFSQYPFWVDSYQGVYHAVLWWSDTEHGDGGPYPSHITRLVSPKLNLGFNPSSPRLTFRLHMRASGKNQDELRVCYRTTPDGEWKLIKAYRESIETWTLQSLALPEPSSSYWICFEANARYGNGVRLDDIRVSDVASAPLLRCDPQLSDGWVGCPYHSRLQAIGGAEPYQWRAQGSLPPGLSLDPATGRISGTPKVEAEGSHTLPIILEGADGFVSTNLLSIKIIKGIRPPYRQNFDGQASLPAGWKTELLTGEINWIFRNGSVPVAGFETCPPSAFSPENNACLANPGFGNKTSKALLILPMTSFPSQAISATLNFTMSLKSLGTGQQKYQDVLRVLYRNSQDGEWVQLKEFNSNYPSWTRQSVALPELSKTCFIAFEGIVRGGHGVCLDDVEISYERDPAASSNLDNWLEKYFTEPYPADQEDSDGDGIANIWEFAFGLDPTDPADGALKMTPAMRDGYFTVGYRESKAAIEDGFKIEVEGCPDLIEAAWTTEGISDWPGSPADSNAWWEVIKKVDLPVEELPAYFLRLKLTYPVP